MHFVPKSKSSDNNTFCKIFYRKITTCTVIFTYDILRLAVCIRNQIWRKTWTLDHIPYVIWLVYSSVWMSVTFVLQRIKSACSDVSNKNFHFGVQSQVKGGLWVGRIGRFCSDFWEKCVVITTWWIKIALFFVFVFFSGENGPQRRKKCEEC